MQESEKLIHLQVNTLYHLKPIVHLWVSYVPISMQSRLGPNTFATLLEAEKLITIVFTPFKRRYRPLVSKSYLDQQAPHIARTWRDSFQNHFNSIFRPDAW